MICQWCRVEDDCELWPIEPIWSDEFECLQFHPLQFGTEASAFVDTCDECFSQLLEEKGQTEMAAKRGRRPKSEYHPEPGLLIALEHFKAQGMKAGQIVVFRDGQAVFDAGNGSRHMKVLPNIDWGCEVDGVKLLATVASMKETASFNYNKSDMTLTCLSGDTRNVLHAAPAENSISQPRFMGAVPPDIDQFTRAGELAKAFNCSPIIYKQKLWVVGRGFIAQFELPTQYANVPIRVLSADASIRMAKCKAPLAAIGFTNPTNLAFFFGENPTATHACVISMGSDKVEQGIDLEKCENFLTNADHYVHSENAEVVQIPNAFFEALKIASGFTEDDLVEFDGLGSMSVGKSSRRVEFETPPCYFAISKLLALSGLTERVSFARNRQHPDLVELWFNDEKVTGCLLSMQVGNVDGATTVA